MKIHLVEEDFSKKPEYLEGTEMNLHNDLKWTIWENIEMMDK